MHIYFILFFTFISCFGFCSSFSEIKSEVDRLPYLRESPIAENIEQYLEKPQTIFNAVTGAHLPGLDFAAFYEVQRQFFTTLEASTLSKQEYWLQAIAPPEGFFDVDHAMGRQHYVQKVVVPAGAKVLLHGDLHGDVHSLVTCLAPYMKGDEGFQLNDDHYVVFLGDYVDKGLYGLECIYVLMRLKIENPDKVFFVRGNHEDIDICSRYGFQAELEKKGFTPEQVATLYRLYDVLPGALYLGTNDAFVQLCHGGLELGYLPTKLLNAEIPIGYEWLLELNRHTVYSQLSEEARKELEPSLDVCKDQMIPVPNYTMAWIDSEKKNANLGFMWTDFVVEEEAPAFYKLHRAHVFNKKITKELLELTNSGQNKLYGILRAHQHTPEIENSMMQLLLANNGIAKLWGTGDGIESTLWPNIVVTFNLSPDTLFGPPNGSWPGFEFDTLGELTTAEEFSGWTLTHASRRF